MDRLKKAKEERVEKENAFEALVNKAKTVALSAEDSAALAALETELQALDTEISTLEAAEKRAGEIAKRKAATAKNQGYPGPGTRDENFDPDADEKKEAAKFSFAKAVQSVMKSKNPEGFDGLERELYDEAAKEAATCGFQLQGNIALPSKFIKIGRGKEKRSLLDVATEGTDVVFTEYGGLIPILNPDPITAQLGITVLQGLNGNVQWPRHTTDVGFSWETESSDVDETTPALDNISISPKRFGGYVDVTMQMLMQSVFVVEPWLRNILSNRFALTVDTAVLNGSGSGNQPTGIFNYPGVNVLSLGSGPSNDMTYAGILEMIKLTKVANARMGNNGWLTNANGEFALARTPRQASGVEGNFIYIPDIGTLIGRRFLTSELVPSDFSEGGQTDLNGIIYSSRWQSLIAGFWGGMDLLFDPYTQAVGGKKRFVVNAFMDVEVEQPLEFAICKDWDATDLPAITA